MLYLISQDFKSGIQSDHFQDHVMTIAYGQHYRGETASFHVNRSKFSKSDENDPTLTPNCGQKTNNDQTTIHAFEYSPLRVYPVEKLAMYQDVPKRFFDFCNLPICLCNATYTVQAIQYSQYGRGETAFFHVNWFDQCKKHKNDPTLTSNKTQKKVNENTAIHSF